MKSIPHLNRALVLEEAVNGPDGAGGFVTTWHALGTLWAEMVAGSGRDPGGEEVILTSTPWRITIRAAPYGSTMRPRPGQRLREGARLFDVTAVAERDVAGRYLLCFCREEKPK